MSDFDFYGRWAQTVVKTVSPNEQIFVTIHGNHDVAVRIDEGYFGRATSVQFCEQFARTCRLAFVDRTRAFFALRSEERGEPVYPENSAWNPHQADYLRRRDELAVEGTSRDGTVTITGVGMRQFAVFVQPGVWERGPLAAFEVSVGEAATALMRDQIEKMNMLDACVHTPRRELRVH